MTRLEMVNSTNIHIIMLQDSFNSFLKMTFVIPVFANQELLDVKWIDWWLSVFLPGRFGFDNNLLGMGSR